MQKGEGAVKKMPSGNRVRVHHPDAILGLRQRYPRQGMVPRLKGYSPSRIRSGRKSSHRLRVKLLDKCHR